MFRFSDFMKSFITNRGIKDYTKCARKMTGKEIEREKLLKSPAYFKMKRRERKKRK